MIYYELMTAAVSILLAFFCGSLPFSVWLGRLLLGVDVRRYGDGNPGAANVFKTGSKLVGLLALILDISKAAAPVGLAYFNFNIRGLEMFLIAVAPILGHAFSPFLNWRGGKAIAAAFGVWIGLTLWKVSLPAALAVLVGYALFNPSGWAVMFSMGVILAVLLIWLPAPLLISVWLAETLILAWTHRADLRQGRHLRPWVVKILGRERN